MAEGVGRSQSVIVVRDDMGVLEIFANQFESKAETAQAICGLAQKWQIGDWMGPPTLRYQGIGWGHPLSGTKEMCMAPFVPFVPGQSGERELHPRLRFRKSFRSVIFASNRGASGCTMSALRRHYGSWSPLGTAWHRKSGKRSWDWRDVLKYSRGDWNSIRRPTTG